MTDDEYRYAEGVLYGYKRQAKKCEELAFEIATLSAKGDIHGQSYSASVGVHGATSDPVARHVEEVMTLERRLRRMMRRVEVIDRLREDLHSGEVITITSPRNLIKILEDYYMAGSTVSEFLAATHWVRSTFYVRRRELVMITGEYLRA